MHENVLYNPELEILRSEASFKKWANIHII